MLSFIQIVSDSVDQGTHSRVRKKRTIPISPPSTVHPARSVSQRSTSLPPTQLTVPSPTQVTAPPPTQFTAPPFTQVTVPPPTQVTPASPRLHLRHLMQQVCI